MSRQRLGLPSDPGLPEPGTGPAAQLSYLGRPQGPGQRFLRVSCFCTHASRSHFGQAAKEGWGDCPQFRAALGAGGGGEGSAGHVQEPQAPMQAHHHLPACKSRGGPGNSMGHTCLGNGRRGPEVPTDLLFPQTCDGHSERTTDAQRMAPAHLPLPSSGRALGMKSAPFPHLTPGLV